jgi:hypothetical protein
MRRRAKPLPSLDALRQILDYDPETGALVWKARTTSDAPKQAQHDARIGKPAGGLDAKGYGRLSINNVRFASHRIAFLLGHGREPMGEIDHIDGDRSNNRLSNLREATHAQNQANKPASQISISRMKGVTLHRRTGKWQSQIRDGGKNRYLGLFNTPEQAHATYVAEAKRIYGEFARFA